MFELIRKILNDPVIEPDNNNQGNYNGDELVS